MCALDASYPQERLAYLMQDSGVALLLTDSRLAERLPKIPGLHTLELDRLDLRDGPETAPQLDLHPDNLAYVILHLGLHGAAQGGQRRPRPVVHALPGDRRTVRHDCNGLRIALHVVCLRRRA